jgi:hypothetical protein
MRHTLRPLSLLLVLGALLPVLGAAPEPATEEKAPAVASASEIAAFALLAAQPEPNADSVHLPAGITDPARRTGFFGNATGGIDAVDLTTGELLWRNDEAGRPLLIDGGRLYAQAGTRRNRLRVLAFDLARQGECVFESDPVVFPGWVVTGEAPGRSFRARWRLEDNRLLLDWEAEAWSDGGGRSPGLAFPLRKHAAGLVRIDLDGGPPEMLPAVQPAAPANEPPRPPQAVAKHLEKKALRWTGQAGHYFLALELAEVDPAEELRQLVEAAKANPTAAAKPKRDKPEYQLVLWAWDTASGAPVLTRELLRGRRPVVQTTLDGRCLCLRDALPSPDEMVASQVRANSGWSLYSALGRPLGRIPYQPGTEALAVVGPRAYCLVAGPVRGPIDRPTERPRTLRAIDLKSGKTAWERPVAPRPLLPPG